MRSDAGYPPGWDQERAIQTGYVAKAFHETYEALAPTFTYQTRKASAVPWTQVPQKNKQLMIATVAALLEQGVIVLPDNATLDEERQS